MAVFYTSGGVDGNAGLIPDGILPGVPALQRRAAFQAEMQPLSGLGGFFDVSPA
jgi:hypothetical protein